MFAGDDVGHKGTDKTVDVNCSVSCGSLVGESTCSERGGSQCKQQSLIVVTKWEALLRGCLQGNIWYCNPQSSAIV